MEHKHPAQTEDQRALGGFFLGLLIGLLIGIFLGTKKGKQILRILTEESAGKLSRLETFLEKRALEKAQSVKEVEDEVAGDDYIKTPPKEVVVAHEELQVIETPHEPAHAVHAPVHEEKRVEPEHVHPVAAVAHVDYKEKEVHHSEKEPTHAVHAASNGVHKKPSGVRRFFKGAKKN